MKSRRQPFTVPRRIVSQNGDTKLQPERLKNVQQVAVPRTQPAEVSKVPCPVRTQEGTAFYKVLYAQKSTKSRKNKTFLDGFISFSGKGIELSSIDGKIVAKGSTKEKVETGATLKVGGWDLEVDEAISEAAFRSGSCFISNVLPLASCGPLKVKQLNMKPMRALTAGYVPAKTSLPVDALALNTAQVEAGTEQLMYLESTLANKLRPHQRQGVQFLFSCLMGHMEADDDDGCQQKHHGAILADEMGLGKTLQVLATGAALMRGGPRGRPVVRKMLVVAPSSLTGNWGAEVKKWLGISIGSLVLLPGKEAASQVTAFKTGNKWKILIASYEYIQKFCADLQGHIDLLICDEGHRLKALNGSATMTALLSLNCPRRVILTGTPVQNNLEEFYAMMSFINPGLLGSQSAFSRVFAKPIKQAKEDGANSSEVAIAALRSDELNRRISPFMLRRTADVNCKYLPPCLQYVVMCRPTPDQLEAYQLSLQVYLENKNDQPTQALPVITRLREICNHQELSAQVESVAAVDALQQIVSMSGKLMCLQHMVTSALRHGERLVVVSTSTRVLDTVGRMCLLHGWVSARIDGSTPPQVRQQHVEAFNRTTVTQVFLLSTRAGGAGLNLIGASRLILFDSDWNPAMDAQAMARIWRDGQRNTCSIYRLLTTGLIDEKIYQRQLYKKELVDVVAGSKNTAGNQAFSQEELKRLFEVNTDTDCDTQEMLAGLAGTSTATWVDIKTTCDDVVLQEAVEEGVISFVHLHEVRGADSAVLELVSDPGPAADVEIPDIEHDVESPDTGPDVDLYEFERSPARKRRRKLADSDDDGSSEDGIMGLAQNMDGVDVQPDVSYLCVDSD